MTLLNDNSINIEVRYKYGRTNIDFLDVQFHIDGDDFVYSALFRKFMSTNTAKCSVITPLKLDTEHPSGTIPQNKEDRRFRINALKKEL